MPRTPIIGPEIFDQASALIEDGKLTKTQIFNKIAKQRRMNPGTVSANYYRVARQRGLYPPLGSGLRRGRKARNPVDRLVNQLDDLTRQAQKVIQDLHEEVEAMKAKYAGLDEIKAVIEKGVSNGRQ